MRRYPDAERAFARATKLSASPGTYFVWAMLQLVRDGSVERAQAVMREAASRRGTDTVVAELVARGMWDVFEFLGEDYERALERLSLSRAPDAPGDYFWVKAGLYSRLHRATLAAAYYDSARATWEAQLRTKRSEPRTHAMLGLALAELDRKADAIREGRTGVALLPISKDAFDGSLRLKDLAELYVRVGEGDAAIDQLAVFLTIPSPISATLLRSDPRWAPLRGNPRFEQLLGAGT